MSSRTEHTTRAQISQICLRWRRPRMLGRRERTSRWSLSCKADRSGDICARQKTHECTRWIAEEGYRRNMIGCLGRHDRRSQIDDARALRISAQHHSCVGASPNHVLYVSTRIVATVSRAHRKIQSCRIVDRVGCQRPAKNLRAERVDECFAHDADAGRLGRAASEYHLDGRARISVGGRDVDWPAQHRRRHRDCNAKDADDLVCTHRSMLTQSSRGSRRRRRAGARRRRVGRSVESSPR